jgi:hypothetical protein
MIDLITHNGLIMIIINYILGLIALCLTGIASVIIHAVICVWLKVRLMPKGKVIFWGNKEDIENEE